MLVMFVVKTMLIMRIKIRPVYTLYPSLVQEGLDWKYSAKLRLILEVFDLILVNDLSFGNDS